MKQTINSVTSAIVDVASEWLIHLHSVNVPARDKVAFANWLKESPAHIREYLSAELLWFDLGHMDFNKLLAADADNVVKLDSVILKIRSSDL